MMEKLGSFRHGIVLAVITLLFGYGMGVWFGIGEDGIKTKFKDDAKAALTEKYEGDQAKANKVTSKAWVYYKRAHLHANGMGTSAIALIFLLTCLGGPMKLRQSASFGLGIGGLGYGLFWYLAGSAAPGMGGTGQAKEAYEWLAIPSTGMFVLAAVTVFVLCIKTFYAKK